MGSNQNQPENRLVEGCGDGRITAPSILRRHASRPFFQPSLRLPEPQISGQRCARSDYRSGPHHQHDYLFCLHKEVCDWQFETASRC
jgi:hypothetical protein